MVLEFRIPAEHAADVLRIIRSSDKAVETFCEGLVEAAFLDDAEDVVAGAVEGFGVLGAWVANGADEEGVIH